jgi:hypothetical protein
MRKRSRERFRRHFRHWNTLRLLPPARYLRAMRLWRTLFGVRPCGLVIADPTGRVGLDLIADRQEHAHWAA